MMYFCFGTGSPETLGQFIWGAQCKWQYISVNTLLEANSHHPKSLIKGIPTGQFHQNCTLEIDYQIEAAEIYTRFRERSCPHRILRRSRSKASKRSDLLKVKPLENQAQNGQPDPVSIIPPFGSRWEEVHNILTKHWHLHAAIGKHCWP